jgi:hypothetical protein
MIRLAEWIRWRKGCRWNHVAVLADPVMIRNAHRKTYVADWTLIQATGKGVVEQGQLCHMDNYEIVPLPEGVDGAKVIEFARAQVGKKYGFLTILSIVVTLGSPKFVNVMLPNTWICSAVAAESLRYGGWLHNWGDLYQVSPAELYDALYATSPSLIRDSDPPQQYVVHVPRPERRQPAPTRYYQPQPQHGSSLGESPLPPR